MLVLQPQQRIADLHQGGAHRRREHVEPAGQFERVRREAGVNRCTHPVDGNLQHDRQPLLLRRADVHPLAELQVADVGREDDRLGLTCRFADAEPQLVEASADELRDCLICHPVSVSYETGTAQGPRKVESQFGHSRCWGVVSVSRQAYNGGCRTVMYDERTEHAMTAAPEVAAVGHLTASELMEGFSTHFYARPFMLGHTMQLSYITGTDDLFQTRETIAWWKQQVGGTVTAERWPHGDAHVVFKLPGIRIEALINAVYDDADFAWFQHLGLSADEVTY